PLAGQEGAVARLLDTDSLGHLPHDQRDVLVVDRHALVAGYLLHLAHEVLLGLADALDLDELLGIARTVDDGVAGGDRLALGDLEASQTGDGVGLLAAVVADDRDDPALALVVGEAHHARRAGQGGLALRAASLEQLDHAGQTASDVRTA